MTPRELAFLICGMIAVLVFEVIRIAWREFLLMLSEYEENEPNEK